MISINLHKYDESSISSTNTITFASSYGHSYLTAPINSTNAITYLNNNLVICHFICQKIENYNRIS